MVVGAGEWGRSVLLGLKKRNIQYQALETRHIFKQPLRRG